MRISRIILTSLLALALVFGLALTAGATSASGEMSAAALDTAEMFSDRDLEQEPELKDAEYLTLTSGGEILIDKAGVYVLSGTASDVSIRVEAADDAKVQLVLSGVQITNAGFPCISVENADKVWVTTTADSSLSVAGESAKGEKVDGVIFSRADLTLNGTAALSISSGENGVVCKDDLRITGGSYAITAAKKCIEANDSIRIADGVFVLNAGSDGMHAENADDDEQGSIYIAGGDFTIAAEDDAIRGWYVVQIDGGSFDISGAEGIEGTYIQINGGTVGIASQKKGINGADLSAARPAAVEINGGVVTIVTEKTNAECIDCNGDLVITGGTVDVTGKSPFDIKGESSFTGGTLLVNGEQADSIPG